MAFTQRLIDEGVDPSVGSVGDALDNALAETTVGSFKNEVIRRQGPWRHVNQVELATAEWVVWFNTERPHEYLDDFTPEAVEKLTTITDAPHQRQGDSTQPVSGLTGTAHCTDRRCLTQCPRWLFSRLCPISGARSDRCRRRNSRPARSCGTRDPGARRSLLRAPAFISPVELPARACLPNFRVLTSDGWLVTRMGVISDEFWAAVESLMPSDVGKRGNRFGDHRQILEGIAWRFRTGSPWRDLPADFGPWQTVWKRHHRWSLDGTYDAMFAQVAAAFGMDEAMVEDLEKLLSVDSTSVRAHQHCAGARSDTLNTGGSVELQESCR